MEKSTHNRSLFREYRKNIHLLYIFEPPLPGTGGVLEFERLFFRIILIITETELLITSFVKKKEIYTEDVDELYRSGIISESVRSFLLSLEAFRQDVILNYLKPGFDLNAKVQQYYLMKQGIDDFIAYFQTYFEPGSDFAGV